MAALATPGQVFWITGYSGAGKTTVAQALRARWRSAGGTPLLLDGDTLRAIFGGGHDYTEETRRALAASYARLCAELASQGADVICATISMFDDVRAWNRTHIARYREIYLRVPLAERQARDPKGLYRASASADPTPMVGLDLHLDEPKSPDLVIDNHGVRTAGDAVEQIWRRFLEDSTT